MLKSITMNTLKIILAAALIVIAGLLWQWGKSGSPSTPVVESEMVRVTSPVANQTVSSPLVVSGEARGTWFFEGSFPLVLVDGYGETVAEGFATAVGEWMTEDFVPFSATLTFDFSAPVYASSDSSRFSGKLILKKDNPSGLPEHDASFEIPVKF